MPGTVSHQENAIKNHKEVTVAYSLEKLASKGQVTNTAGVMEKPELPHTAVGDVKWCGCCGKQSESSSED